MTTTAVSIIISILGLLLLGYLKSKSAESDAKQAKVDALEQAADEARKAQEEADELEARTIIASRDRARAIGFLQDSWKSPDSH